VGGVLVLDPPAADLAFLLEPVEQGIDRAAGKIESSRHLDALEEIDAVGLLALEDGEHRELGGALAELGLPGVQVHRGSTLGWDA
jgi:hypothetical protein